MSRNNTTAVSIIIPVYNEVATVAEDVLSPRILALLELLRAGDEIVLVDGGSIDASWKVLSELAQHPGIAAIQSPKGRARQMNAGAAKAKGQVLLFLHADTTLTATAWHEFLQKISEQQSEFLWGRFDVCIEGQSRWLPVVGWFMNHRSRLSKIGTGDQALFVSRKLFLQAGAFPEQPLMEDIELCKRLKRIAPQQFKAIRCPVYTSGRRWDEQGAWKTIVLMWRFRFNYWRGVPASELARQYTDVRDKLKLTVAVFAKYPERGRVKTRLEPLLGAAQCVEFAKYLLLSTLDKLQSQNVVLWTDGGTDEQWSALLNGRRVKRLVQPAGHLGIRMQTAVQTHLPQSEVVVLLGPDAVQFTVEDLSGLLKAAKENVIAFVPALDGGYVALACTQCLPAVFSEEIDWGTARVTEQTKTALNQCNVQAQWFEPQMDIDEPEDLLTAMKRGCVPTDWAVRYSHKSV